MKRADVHLFSSVFIGFHQFSWVFEVPSHEFDDEPTATGLKLDSQMPFESVRMPGIKLVSNRK